MSVSKSKRRENGAGCISQRQDGKWVAKYQIGINERGKPKFKTFLCHSEREAKRKLRDFIAEFHRHDSINVQRGTVQDYMLGWLNDVKRNKLKPKSFDRLECTLTHQVLPLIGHMQVSALSSDNVQRMINELQRDYSLSTVRKAYDAVHDCFATAYLQHKIVSDPCVGVTLPSKKAIIDKYDDGADLRFYSLDEARRICNAATSTYNNGVSVFRLGYAFPLVLNTGVRQGELLALRWDDVDFCNRTLFVHRNRVTIKNRNSSVDRKYIEVDQNTAKTDASTRLIDLNDDAITALRHLYAITGEFDYVMSTPKGSRVSERNLYRSFGRACRAAGIAEDKVYGLHALRHTFASLLFGAGVDIKTISELLGHADTSVTYNTYIHLIQGRKRSAVQQIPNMTELNL